MAALGVLCLMGPTAVGKTALAMALAERAAFELVSVDSAMVYRGLDIGSGKPSAQELRRFPHHLIDIRDHPQLAWQLTWNRIQRPSRPAGYTKKDVKAFRERLGVAKGTPLILSLIHI